ncbi:hypothetical protein FOWG_04520 [Fusarium oxysporum f. sp. lycopersici MN25]|nr:hypothetical protein FOWG_04520 [Fusarium oxysporum f. sp. lycopersici MN25]
MEELKTRNEDGVKNNLRFLMAGNEGLSVERWVWPDWFAWPPMDQRSIGI